MLRNIGGVIIGVLVGAIIIFVVESAGHVFFPPPDGATLKDPEALKSIMRDIPIGAKLAVILAWFLGILGGGTAGLLVARKWAPVAWVVAGTLFGMAVVTMVQIPHPWWMVLGSVAATLLGAYGAIRITNASYQMPTKEDPLPDFR